MGSLGTFSMNSLFFGLSSTVLFDKSRSWLIKCVLSQNIHDFYTVDLEANFISDPWLILVALIDSLCGLASLLILVIWF